MTVVSDTSSIGRMIGVLDDRHIISLIIFLYENGPSRRIDIYQNVSRISSMPKKFDSLKESGLLDEDDRSNLFLTDAGMSVARLLLCIDDVIGNAGCRA